MPLLVYGIWNTAAEERRKRVPRRYLLRTGLTTARHPHMADLPCAPTASTATTGHKNDRGCCRPDAQHPQEESVFPAVYTSVVVHTIDIIQLVDGVDGAGEDRPILLVDGMCDKASGNIVMDVRAALRFVADQLRI